MAVAKKLTKKNKVTLVKNDTSDIGRYKMICEAAYYRAEQRNFQGDDMQDWLRAEQEIDNQLNI